MKKQLIIILVALVSMASADFSFCTKAVKNDNLTDFKELE